MSYVYWAEWRHSVLSGAGDHHLRYYADAYRTVAQASFDLLTTDTSVRGNFLIQPYVLNARMAVELILKYAVACKQKYLKHDLDYYGHVFFDSRPKRLGLMERLEGAADILNANRELFGDEEFIFKEQDISFLRLLDSIDPNSEKSRYPEQELKKLRETKFYADEPEIFFVTSGKLPKIELHGFNSRLLECFDSIKSIAGKIDFVFYERSQDSSGEKKYLWENECLIMRSRVAGMK